MKTLFKIFSRIFKKPDQESPMKSDLVRKLDLTPITLSQRDYQMVGRTRRRLDAYSHPPMVPSPYCSTGYLTSNRSPIVYFIDPVQGVHNKMKNSDSSNDLVLTIEQSKSTIVDVSETLEKLMEIKLLLESHSGIPVELNNKLLGLTKEALSGVSRCLNREVDTLNKLPNSEIVTNVKYLDPNFEKLQDLQISPILIIALRVNKLANSINDQPDSTEDLINDIVSSCKENKYNWVKFVKAKFVNDGKIYHHTLKDFLMLAIYRTYKERYSCSDGEAVTEVQILRHPTSVYSSWVNKVISSSESKSGYLLWKDVLNIAEELIKHDYASQSEDIIHYDCAGKPAFAQQIEGVNKERLNPVAEVVAWNHPQEKRKIDFRWLHFDVKPGTLLYAIKEDDIDTPERKG